MFLSIICNRRFSPAMLGIPTINDAKIGKQLFEDANKYAPEKEIGNLKSNILIFHGEDDEIIPIIQSKEIVTKYNNVKLQIVPKEKHSFYNTKNFQKIAQETVDYLI